MRIARHFLLLTHLLTAAAWAEDFEARDSFQGSQNDSAEASAVLDALSYPAQSFTVTALPTEGQVEWDQRVFFPSPLPSGDDRQDTVRLRWYQAQGVAEGQTAPAVILVHSLHPDMPVAIMLGRALARAGIHGLVFELPGYGGRVGPDRKLTGVTTLIHGRQAITDCRRASSMRYPFCQASIPSASPCRAQAWAAL